MIIFNILFGLVSAVLSLFVGLGMRILVMTVSGILVLLFVVWVLAGQ